MSLDELALNQLNLPREREIVLYCGCRDLASAQGALLLRRKDLPESPAGGGIEAGGVTSKPARSVRCRHLTDDWEWNAGHMLKITVHKTSTRPDSLVRTPGRSMGARAGTILAGISAASTDSRVGI